MARHLRLEYPGAIYHVTCRMIGDWRTEQARLFRDDADCERFIDRLAERVEQCRIRLFMFVLMSNHFHLVFETPAANCSRFMQTLTTAYTVYYNLRHRRHGHLLDGRFKARMVGGDDYLLALSRYVHLNPVQINSQKSRPLEERIAYLRGYSWSSYPGYIGKRKGREFVTYGPLLAEMSGKRQHWPRRYREYVESGLAESDDEFKAEMKLSPRSIGSDGFRAWVDDLYQRRVKTHPRPEDISFRHITEPLAAGKVLAVLEECCGAKNEEFKRRCHGSPLRALAARFLVKYSGLSQREVADLLNVGSGAAVGNQLARLPDKLSEDRELRRLVEQIELRLNSAQSERIKADKKVE